jgi:hypothetical protein
VAPGDGARSPGLSEHGRLRKHVGDGLGRSAGAARPAPPLRVEHVLSLDEEPRLCREPAASGAAGGRAAGCRRVRAAGVQRRAVADVRAVGARRLLAGGGDQRFAKRRLPGRPGVRILRLSLAPHRAPAIALDAVAAAGTSLCAARHAYAGALASRGLGPLLPAPGLEQRLLRDARGTRGRGGGRAGTARDSCCERF